MNLFCWTIRPDGKAVLFRGDGVPDATRGTLIPADAANLAACLNAAARYVREGLLLTLPPDLIALDPGAKQTLRDAAERHTAAVFFYGDYRLRSEHGEQVVRVRSDIGDITEREDWGPLWAVRCEWLNRCGGLDESCPRAAFYDLLLKSFGHRVHVGTILGTIAEAAPDASAKDLQAKLFFPGRGKYGGFSYLFLDPEEERQIETVFTHFLQREGAFLAGERTAVPPPPAQTGPLVSVITAVHNRARFVGAAIESVQRQTLTDWEYLLVDNGSSDGTREVIRRYAAHDPRVRLIENDRNIIALALNLAVRAARGKYIAQLDSDDEYLPHTLAVMTAALDAHPTWALAIGYYELMDEHGRTLPEFGIIKHLEYNRNNILRVDGAGAPRVWHRSAILEFGGFDEQDLGDYGEDYDLVLKVGEKYEVGRVHEVAYRYRRHPDNTDVRRDPEMKIRNKTLARLRALARRRALNQSP